MDVILDEIVEEERSAGNHRIEEEATNRVSIPLDSAKRGRLLALSLLNMNLYLNLRPRIPFHAAPALTLNAKLTVLQFTICDEQFLTMGNTECTFCRFCKADFRN